MLEAEESALEGPLATEPFSLHPPTDPARWWALAAVLSAAFLGPLDFFIVNIAIPSIQNNLGATAAQIQLVITCYGLTYAVLLVTGGRLGDIWGRKKMFMIGMGGFTIASALCGFAHSPVALIFGRVLQGVMGAMMSPQVLSIIHVSLPPHERRLAFGIFGVVVGLGAFAGNVLGGELIKANILGLGWRPIFLVNLPIGMIALFGAYHWVRESRSPHALKLDPGGVVLATVTLFLMVFPFVEGREAGWPAWAFICLAASVPLTVIFILYERRVHDRGGSPGLSVELTLCFTNPHVCHWALLYLDFLRRPSCFRAPFHRLFAGRSWLHRPGHRPHLRSLLPRLPGSIAVGGRLVRPHGEPNHQSGHRHDDAWPDRNSLADRDGCRPVALALAHPGHARLRSRPRAGHAHADPHRAEQR